ncbi:MAG TPA: HAMP domain-containing sensor histidine kinase [Verrucomicrobiae bacterium]
MARLRSMDPVIPEHLRQNTEATRLAHLTARFGLLGSIFGMVFVVFYLVIGHKWGADIVLLCSTSFAATPHVMKRVRKVEVAGNLLVMTMALGFFALCCVEGGLSGHAIAWLVTIPLCALLLVGTKAARSWAIIIFGAAALIASVDLSGRKMPVTFDLKWNPVVSSAGYLGLIVFMYALGLIFETSRARAFGRMQDALRELATTNEHLVQLNLEKNEFLGIAAHDLKSPLTVILGCAEMINFSKDPKQVHKMSDSIVAASTRMKNLINDLLDANAIEQGKYASKLEPCDLSSLVKQSVDNNQPAAARKNITLLLGATPGLWAKADQAATLQILDNLISNALKFSPPMTTVHVHTMPEAENMVVAVRDQGPGLSEDDQKKLFGKFTRLTARPTGGEGSTGLGLSIVKRLAEVMSGTVQCHSVLGAGATFSLRLPKCAKGEIPKIAVVNAEAQPVCIPFPTTEQRASIRVS